MSSSNNTLETTKQIPVSSGESETAVRKDSASFFRPSFTFGEFSGWLALGMPALCILMALIEGSSYIWRPIAVVLYATLILVGIKLTFNFDDPDILDEILMLLVKFTIIALAKLTNHAEFYSLVEKIEETEEEYERSLETIHLKYYSAANLALALLGGIVVLVGFSQVNRHLSFLLGGFTAEQMGYWHWLRFGLSNLLESVLFDIPTIYEWNFSEIRAVSTWSHTLVFVFRATIEFLVVVTILHQAKRAWKIWVIQPRRSKTSPKNYLGLIIPKAGELLLMIFWGLPIAIGIVAVINNGLSLEITWSFVKLAAPVLFGVWVTWHSLRGLVGLTGLWNKLFATAGLIGGIWVIQEYWPAFRTFFDH